MCIPVSLRLMHFIPRVQEMNSADALGLTTAEQTQHQLTLDVGSWQVLKFVHFNYTIPIAVMSVRCLCSAANYGSNDDRKAGFISSVNTKAVHTKAIRGLAKYSRTSLISSRLLRFPSSYVHNREK